MQMQACAPLCTAGQQFNDVTTEMSQVYLDKSELPSDQSYLNFVDLAGGMLVSHVKIFQRVNDEKVELIPSLSTMLEAGVEFLEFAIKLDGFQEVEGQEIIVDVWGCSKGATSYDPTNLDLQTYSFSYLNLTLYDCANQVVTGQLEHTIEIQKNKGV